MSELATMSQKAIEVLATGNLANLTPAEKTHHYQAVCTSLGLNPLTRPFEYITLNGKLALYARKDATDQLRKVHGISIGEPVIRFEDEWIIVTVSARTADGRTDSDLGAVSKKDMQGNFGNSLMKAVTKSKRRVTLSICGLGMLDETEVETIPNAVIHNDTLALPPKATPVAPVDKPDRDLVVGHEANIRESQTVVELAVAGNLIKLDKGLTDEGRDFLRRAYSDRKRRLETQPDDANAGNQDIPL